ncbi:uncharacterized protein LOC129767471 [Toxorhynchites rutilus septentrionalis]|uniref:uncharacterized protein LOC129767471 n=1 Tax=Toxorhynchites rutilus septentrionalis TaxID=329112 RepID=UPI00247A0EDA|nr:uncharacterized protein LOC129767471 [Toxorhynchites rutilus septentrionalis]
MTSNRFSKPLTESLTSRLRNLKTSQAFQMALYLDPRRNYLNSKLFSNHEKQYIQSCIRDTWNRISELKPSTCRNEIMQSEANNSSQFDEFLTELFGGTLSTSNSSNDSTFEQQLKALDAELRQNHTFDVFQYWLMRRETHPELFNVAMVVLATPSNQVSVERAFSALALVLTSHRTGLGPGALDDILLLKQNRNIFEKVSASHDWVSILGSVKIHKLLP